MATKYNIPLGAELNILLFNIHPQIHVDPKKQGNYSAISVQL
jgi:hypothetical protein